MTISNEYHGLCPTCKSSPYCTFPVPPTESVFQCEEFEGAHINPVNLKRNPHEVSFPSIPLQTWPGPVERVHNKYTGLCSTCESSETCTFQKPEGGVWHCEEYK